MSGAALRRWASVMGVAVLVAVGCATAGVWQWHRHLARSAAAALVEANYDADPVPVADLLGAAGQLPAGDVWRPVLVVGHYRPGASVLLRNRPVDGQPAFHVLETLVVDDGALTGSVLVVDRGWVPTGDDPAQPAAVPQTPPGTVDVVVRLRPQEPDSSRGAPPGQVQAIAVDQVLAASGATGRAPDVLAYGVVASEDGAPVRDLGAVPRPDTDLGPHLSYAFQWWVFAVGALVGGVLLGVRDARSLDGAPAGGTVAPAPSRRRRPTAEEEEDALLDAQTPAAR